MKKLFTTTLVAATLLVGCAKDEGISQSPNESEVRITSSIATRMSDNTWEEDDAIGVAMKSSGFGSGEGIFNVLYTTDGDGNFTSENPLYFPTSGTVDLLAYYPYVAGTDENPFSLAAYAVNVASQTTPSDIDLMRAELSGVKSTSKAVDMTFEHKLARLVLNITPGGSLTAANLEGLKVKIGGTHPAATYNLFAAEENSAVTLQGEKGDIEMLVTTDTQSGAVTGATAIVVPQELEGVKFTFESANDGIFEASLATKKFDIGKSYNYNIKISNTGVKITSSNITDWVPDTDSTDDDLTVEEIPGPGDPIVFKDKNFEKALLAINGLNNDGDMNTITYREAAAYSGELVIWNNYIAEMPEIQYFTAITSLACADNNLSTLDVSKCEALEDLQCFRNPNLETLIVSGCTNLKELYCDGTAITSLDVTSCTELERLSCSETAIKELDLTNCTALMFLCCASSRLTTLDVSKCPNVGKPEGDYIFFALQVGNQTSDGTTNQTLTLYVSDEQSANGIGEFINDHGFIENSNVKVISPSSVIEFVDNNFEEALLAHNDGVIDTDNSGTITYAEAAAYNGLINVGDKNIILMPEIQYFTAMREIWCWHNAGLTTLDLSKCKALNSVLCLGCAIESLDISGCTKLTNLVCYNNHLSDLDVSGCPYIGKNIDKFSYNADALLVGDQTSVGGTEQNMNLYVSQEQNSGGLTQGLVDKKSENGNVTVKVIASL